MLMALDLAKCSILELAVLLEEQFGGLVVSITVAKGSSGQECEHVGRSRLLDISATNGGAETKLWA